MEDFFKELDEFGGADVKTTGEESKTGVSPVIGEPGNYMLFITGIANVKKSASGKVQIKFAMETAPVPELKKPVESAKLGGRVASVQMGIYFDPADANNKQTQEFFKNLGIIAKKGGKLDQFNALPRDKFGTFLKGFIDLMGGVELAYQLGGEQYFKQGKGENSDKVFEAYALNFGRYNFVKNSLEELTETTPEHLDKITTKFDPETSQSESQLALYKIFMGETEVGEAGDVSSLFA